MLRSMMMAAPLALAIALACCGDSDDPTGANADGTFTATADGDMTASVSGDADFMIVSGAFQMTFDNSPANTLVYVQRGNGRPGTGTQQVVEFALAGEGVKAWQARPLDAVYPIVYLDAIHVKMRTGGHVQTQAVYLALALTLSGEKELLGLWVGEAEGAKFWLGVLTELKNRGVQDILIAAIDGLAGFPEAIATVFPKTQVQLCIVHMVRGSMAYVSYKDRRAVARDLKAIYTRHPPSRPGKRRWRPSRPAGTPGSP